MANDGWDFPTYANVSTLQAYVNYTTINLKSQTGWLTSATPGLNGLNFSAVGSGLRYSDGTFVGSTTYAMWTKSNWSGDNASLIAFEYNTYGFYIFGAQSKKQGLSLRLFRPLQLGEQTIPDGQPVGTYTGNDGFVYPTVRIGNQVWLACNLAETKLRNGDLIPVITDNTAWSALTTGAMCYYGNDFNNVFI